MNSPPRSLAGRRRRRLARPLRAGRRRSSTRAGSIELVRGLQQHVWVERLEAIDRGARHGGGAGCARPAGSRARRCTPTFLCRDKPAMKEVLRDGRHPLRGVDRRHGPADEVREFAAEVGFPLVSSRPPAPARRAPSASTVPTSSRRPSPAAASTTASRSPSRSSSRATRASTTRSPSTAEVAMEFATHYYPNVLEAMRTRWISPQFVTTNRIDAAELRRGQGDGPGRDHGARHRHVGHAHGVVRRAQGPVLLARSAAARPGVRVLGPLRRRQRHRHLPGVGDRRRPRARRRAAVAALRRRHHRPAPRPRRRDHAATTVSTRSSSATASG